MLTSSHDDQLVGVVGVLPVPVVVARRHDLTIVAANDACTAAFGWTQADLLGSNLVAGDFIATGNRLRLLEELADNGRVDNWPIIINARPDGPKAFSIAIVTTPYGGEDCFLGVCLDEGERARVCTISTDITDRRRAELEAETARSEAETARADAEAANLRKSEFLSRMSHELRTPLNAVLGFSQLLELDDLTDKQRRHLHHIHDAGKHLLELIDDLLDISRIETGQLRLSLEVVELTEVVHEVVELMRPAAAITPVTMRPGPGLYRRTFVRADRQRLKQVVINLLSNAIKYNRVDGLIDLDASRDDDRVELRVTDTGVGIHPDDMARLFQPFERLGDPLAVEGTGVGLALSEQLVGLMNGSLAATSAVGQGTTFSMHLPAAELTARGELPVGCERGLHLEPESTCT
jgi:signal transduction histidine kinase